MGNWKDNPQYWRNAMAAGQFWTSAKNAHGLEMNDCSRLFENEHGDLMLSEHLEEADKYKLADIHARASEECRHGAQGHFRGYSWTDSLGYYAQQPDFFDELAALGALPAVQAPERRGEVLQCLWDRQTNYNAQLERAERAALEKASKTAMEAPQQGYEAPALEEPDALEL